MPGFVSIKTFAADDGERISIVEFDSEAAHGAWRNHPEHREAQRLGRERFYDEFQIQVCTPVRRSRPASSSGCRRQPPHAHRPRGPAGGLTSAARSAGRFER